MANGARLTAALLSYCEAAAGRHRVATAIIEAADLARLMELQDEMPVRILTRITGRATDLISPLAR